jgi:hypothetical protein
MLARHSELRCDVCLQEPIVDTSLHGLEHARYPLNTNRFFAGVFCHTHRICLLTRAGLQAHLVLEHSAESVADFERQATKKWHRATVPLRYENSRRAHKCLTCYELLGSSDTPEEHWQMHQRYFSNEKGYVECREHSVCLTVKQLADHLKWPHERAQRQHLETIFSTISRLEMNSQPTFSVSGTDFEQSRRIMCERCGLEAFHRGSAVLHAKQHSDFDSGVVVGAVRCEIHQLLFTTRQQVTDHLAVHQKDPAIRKYLKEQAVTVGFLKKVRRGKRGRACSTCGMHIQRDRMEKHVEAHQRYERGQCTKLEILCDEYQTCVDKRSRANHVQLPHVTKCAVFA